MKKALIGVLVAMAFLTGCKEDGAHVGNVQMANPGDDYNVRSAIDAKCCVISTHAMEKNKCNCHHLTKKAKRLPKLHVTFESLPT